MALCSTTVISPPYATARFAVGSTSSYNFSSSSVKESRVRVDAVGLEMGVALNHEHGLAGRRLRGGPLGVELLPQPPRFASSFSSSSCAAAASSSSTRQINSSIASPCPSGPPSPRAVAPPSPPAPTPARSAPPPPRRVLRASFSPSSCVAAASSSSTRQISSSSASNPPWATLRHRQGELRPSARISTTGSM
ncbi:unnamed protein product [Miscanthus lutarioriparius]|uniref:Uncharacterized protein n=1 Tax=Miscanthus lutarioriparius TaxID=422564 RepID=A0A811QCI4_9POAL|nr:unnamed protein product [Miscanthus lutarioriparius]